MPDGLPVYTTRPDTLYGASFLAIAADHPLSEQLAKADPKVAAFIAEVRKGGTSEAEIEQGRLQLDEWQVAKEHGSKPFDSFRWPHSSRGPAFSWLRDPGHSSEG